MKFLGNASSANTNISKTQLHKIGQSGGFLGRLLGPLLKPGLPLIKNGLKSLVKSVLIPLGLTAAASATFIRKCFDMTYVLSALAKRTTLIISNEEMNDIMKIVKLLEEVEK